LVAPAPSKGGRGKLLYLPPPKKLVVGNYPVKTGTSGSKIETSRIWKLAVTTKIRQSGLENVQ
jgi:hypothetical protein